MLRTEPSLRPVVGTYDAAFRDVAPRLTAVARRVLGDPGEAEDVVQEAFLRLDGDPVLSRPAGEVAGWLHRVTLNLAFNRVRDTRRWRDRAARGGHPEPGAEVADEPLRQVLLAERRDTVRALLAELGDKQRDCLLLRHSGYSYAEIATATGIAPGSVGTTLARAERAFRLLYEEHDHAVS